MKREYKAHTGASAPGFISSDDYFKERIAIVTGGASGIGRALCEELGRRGTTVIVTDINIEGAEQTANIIRTKGGKAWAFHLDVRKREEVYRCIQETKSRYGRIDFIFNNAGIVCVGDARDIDIEDWQSVIDVNLMGVLYGSLAAYQIMAEQGFGHIVNIASAGGLLPLPFQGPYVTSKFGVVGFSRTLRLEGAPLGVRVSVACPGFVRTEMFNTAKIIKVPREKVIAWIPKPLIMDVKKAALKILSGVKRNKEVIVFPFPIRILWFLYRLFPPIALPFARRFIKYFRSLRKES
jgi:NAD(P)-dependent dehydrogenase (short-subunit alcohol dehydrogenase family)